MNDLTYCDCDKVKIYQPHVNPPSFSFGCVLHNLDETDDADMKIFNPGKNCIL